MTVNSQPDLSQSDPTIDEYSKSFENYKEFLNKVVRYDFEIFGIDKKSQILDIGCGFGDRVRALSAQGYHQVFGVEASSYSVEQANDSRITLGSITATGYPEKSIDVAFVENVFHHIADYQAALLEIKRILRPGGMLCFIEPRNSFLRRLLDIVTFYTPVPSLLRGPWKMRYVVMGAERETGLYQQWLKNHKLFRELLDEHFEILWLKKNSFFIFGKCQLRSKRA